MNIESIREYCLSKKGVTEGFPFNHTALVFKVAGKMVALLDLSADSRGISLKCDPDLAIELREQYPEVTPACHFNKMNWNTIKNIEKQYLQEHYSKPFLDGITRIAIDEFAVLKGHVYMTVVLDLDSGRVLFVGKDRSKESLDVFWKRVKRSGAQIKAVAMDMWPAYIGSVIENCPDADIVFDHFHIIKMLNQKLDEIRRDLFRDETEYNKRSLMKGTRWLLLKNQENLSQTALERLNEALAVNKPLAAAYYLNEELKLLWCQDDIQKALEFLASWVKRAYETGLFKLREFAITLMSHYTGILNWYKHRISTGKLEGFNNKIKVLKRKAYGYRDFDFFIPKIHALHLSRYELL